MRLIDGDALIERLKQYKDKYGADKLPYDIVHDAFIYEIEKEPTVEAVPVIHGKWLPENRTMDAFWVCSCCGFPSEAHGAFKIYKFCPNCGAKLDLEED